jgi:hypothetical protein
MSNVEHTSCEENYGGDGEDQAPSKYEQYSKMKQTEQQPDMYSKNAPDIQMDHRQRFAAPHDTVQVQHYRCHHPDVSQGL